MASDVMAVEEINQATNQSQIGSKLLLIAASAAVIAVMVVVWLWSKQPDYRILFSNYSDKDGGAIVAALEQMNVPFKFSDGGSAILVPAEHVHEARLKLASQGLPKGGNVGFELLENQKFGVSQFVEQVNFQRALEGELEKSIQSVDAVDVARVHLAIPKSSVFVRDQLKPTASVLLNLRGGRTLDNRQVSAIVHLVASSVPELPAENVTIVDQNGNLLSDTSKQDGQDHIDPSKLKYIEELQRKIAQRVESIITPIVGANNVRAEASAEIDFSTVEQAAESYKPNQKPDDIVVRSTQTNESQNTNTSTGGVPGALSNQPPAPATAPLTSNDPNAAGGANGTPSSSQRSATTNYEVDKTIRYMQQPMGNIKRLTVAVVVNHKSVVGKDGKTTTRALTDAEKTQISDLTKQAMGFDEARGDKISVVNSPFASETPEVIKPDPLWKQPGAINFAKDLLKYLIGIFIILMIYKKLLKPMVTKLVTPPPPPELPAPAQLESQQGELVTLSDGTQTLALPAKQRGYQQNLEATKQIAKDNPKLVANVVTAWVGDQK